MPDKQVIPVPGLKTIGPYSQAVRATGLFGQDHIGNV